jgi:hypothetical protein
MANNLKITNALASLLADLVSDQLDNGYLRIYDGAQPATPDTAIGAQVLLAELRFNATFSGAAASGVLTASAITGDASADATGTAAWFRAFKADGTTAVLDGSVGVAGCDLNLTTTAIVATAPVAITSLTVTHLKA